MFSLFFYIYIFPEGFAIMCNTQLTSDKINFIFAILRRCNQRAICLSAQNYNFLLALHVCVRNIARQSVLPQAECHASDLSDPCHHYPL